MVIMTTMILATVFRDIVSPIRLSGGWISLSLRME